MAQSPKKPHLVSEVLLKQWSRPIPGNDKAITTFYVEFGTVNFKSPAAICYAKDLSTRDSQEFEDTWQSVESKIGRILPRINAGSQVDTNTNPVLQEFLAVHLVRSFSYRERHRRRMLQGIQALDLRRVPSERLVSMDGKKHSEPYPPYMNDRVRIEEEWRSNLTELFVNGPYSAEAMMTILPYARDYIDRRSLTIVHAGDGDSEFVVGDCPVLPLKGSSGLAEEPFGPAVGAYFFPVGPKYGLFTANRNSDLAPHEVAWLNCLQVQSAQKWVVWTPDRDFAGFAKSVRDASSSFQS